MIKVLRDAMAAIAFAFIPDRCSLCGEVVMHGETYCDDCADALRPKGELCPKCGKEKENCDCDEVKFRCDYTAFAAPFYFRNSIARGIIRFKNYNRTELAKTYADEISCCVHERFADAEFDCVTYIPMTGFRQFRRGYNQSKILAEAVAEKLSLPLEDLLVKTRKTKSQRNISARERKTNLHGAFDLAMNAGAEGKCILIVDDIKTTGSTLSECALTLKAYGAKDVYATAVALVDKNKH